MDLDVSSDHCLQEDAKEEAEMSTMSTIHRRRAFVVLAVAVS
jgi:hypothetical protein